MKWNLKIYARVKVFRDWTEVLVYLTDFQIRFFDFFFSFFEKHNSPKIFAKRLSLIFEIEKKTTLYELPGYSIGYWANLPVLDKLSNSIFSKTYYIKNVIPCFRVFARRIFSCSTVATHVTRICTKSRIGWRKGWNI